MNEDVSKEALIAYAEAAREVKHKLKSEEEIKKEKGYADKLRDKKKADDKKTAELISEAEQKKAAHEAMKELNKNRMKKEIQLQAAKAKAKEEANSFGSFAKRTIDKAEDLVGRLAEAVAEFFEDHPLILIITLLILIVVLSVACTFSSCATFFTGGGEMVIATSYTAQDWDLRYVEDDYIYLEEEILENLEHIEETHPGYDEYRYELDHVEHDPYELAALLTVLLEDYTEAEAAARLEEIRDLQYVVTYEETRETRTRTETEWQWVTYYDEVERTGYRRENGKLVSYTYIETVEREEYEPVEVEVEYEVRILNTKLKNNYIHGAVDSIGLNDDQRLRYEVILEFRGNKPGIFD